MVKTVQKVTFKLLGKLMCSNSHFEAVGIRRSNLLAYRLSSTVDIAEPGDEWVYGDASIALSVNPSP